MLYKVLKIFLASLCIIALILPAEARNPKSVNDSLLHELDKRVANRGLYEASQQKKLKELWARYDHAGTYKGKFHAIHDLFDQYKRFSMDTTMMLAREAFSLAKANNDRDTLLWQSRLMLSEAEKGLGHYEQALKILDSIPPEAHKCLRNEIVSRYCSVYYSLSENIDNPLPYRRKLLAYRDTLTRESTNRDAEILNRLEYLKLKPDIASALKLYEEYTDSLTKAGKEINDALTYVGGELYLYSGDTIQAMNNLARVAIHDMEKGVRKYTSLTAIAKILYDEGDYDRAYHYIITSLNDVRKAKAQSRMAKVLDNLPIISQAYEEQQNADRNMRLLYTVTAAVFVILLLLAAGALFLQHKRLKNEHDSLTESHAQLSRMKLDLDELNAKLSLSNHTKEEYIISLLNLCHEYISIMNTHHNTLIKLIKGGANMNQVSKYISTMGTSQEMNSFYTEFDETILAIFPDFIKGFNALMQEEYRTDPDAKTLTPELRIYALVRLGMNDSVKIATLLQYSTQTVYNYRFRARQHSLLPKEEFLEAVKRL